ncbi:MAG: anti-sigma regulatory factor [Moorea sp. SIO1F2]|uniref:ATP-binding protein n=1 Tax=unclassified Moorena TaxID=2683338 RepID=UPI0013BC8FC6|nr:MULTISPECIES: anti-sigma regulatory factor [unclassified Moorena]NEO04194.1 anti-sigma regulatory factor [Moorena sp. SIO3I8]NEO21814.1 anti-sigma regulatory factor [Moorena sp. SIO4A5]NEP20831.1 anti-sigma regulatory factor [Moorena sp. SIO3I6]NEQ57927.1 anti-sigma regulatory factor [Moorena sp. SIO4A1]NET85190.1 anti-sigma regulatory factor [Moorena sp. SIO1F2]
MIATSLSPAECGWETVSFASTLYLCPILDLLLEQIPNKWQPELRLGLQEALVNAAKHGNNLDPSKTVEVQFSVVNGEYWWVISDEGSGFTHGDDQETTDVSLPCDESESGRGMSLLHQIFDQVLWNNQGTEIRLCKQVKHPSKRPLFS